MKILVCISKVPDTTTKISFTDNNTKFNEDKVQFIVNPYDESYALVKALEIIEKGGGSLTIINVGLADNDQIIRKALAIGADEAVRIDADPADAYFVAAQIAEYAKGQNYDLIFTGKETISYNEGVVGGMVAELLNLPYISPIEKMDIEGNKVVVERVIDGGVETVTCPMPVVVSAQKGLAEARIPNMRGIMAARTKPLKVVPAFNVNSLVSTKVYGLPDPKSACKYIDAEHPELLVDLLHSEAKVI